MDLDTVLMGLYITVVGMSLVFLALGLMVLAIQLMGRAFRPRPEAGPGQEALPETDGEERARVAAITAAIVLAVQQGPHHPDDSWRLAGHSETGPWQAAHHNPRWRLAERQRYSAGQTRTPGHRSG